MVGIGHIDRFQLRQAVQRGGDQVGGQRAGTGHQQCFGIGAGQVFSADGPGRAGAEIGDGAGVQQRPGRAGVYIEQQRGAVQGGQVFGGVIAEPGHHLHAVKPQAVHMAGLDIQVRRTGGELVEHHGPQGRTAGALFQIGLLHGPNRHGDGQQRLDGRAVQYRQFCHGLLLLITMCRQRRPRPPGRPAGSACHRRSRYAYCGAARSSRRG